MYRQWKNETCGLGIMQRCHSYMQRWGWESRGTDGIKLVRDMKNSKKFYWKKQAKDPLVNEKGELATTDMNSMSSLAVRLLISLIN